MNRLFTPVLAATAAAGLLAAAADSPSLAERLGYKPDARLLIVNADDTGMCHAANQAVIESFEHGLITTATVMVPCPWFNEIAEDARQHPTRDYGIHLCHTAEWKKYRWGPLAPRDQIPGLVDKDGYLWSSVEEVYAHADPEQALVEARAQIRRALAAGIDITHLDSHMGTLQYDAKYMESYLKLAVEFHLPVRMASQETLLKFGQPALRAKFAAAGVVFPDYLIHEELSEESKDVKGFWLRLLANLRPGVTEIYIHPAKPTEELQAITGSWRTRGAEFDAFTNDPAVRSLIAEKGITRIGYRPLRDRQRRR
jgi:predicted glycoside hydrolase/deacetylase ChbG (UPF0249 family)